MIYNSPIEIGLRSLIILYYKTERANIDVLNFLDYLTIYLNDFNSNFEKIHPNLPLKLGEISSKREGIKKGLNILVMKGLAERKFSEGGIEYHITESGKLLVDLLNTEYSDKLKIRAEQAVEQFWKKDSLELYKEIMGA